MGIDERREIDAVFNAPIVDSLNAKISVYRKDQGGDYMTNVYSGRDENTEDYTIISTTLALCARIVVTPLKLNQL